MNRPPTIAYIFERYPVLSQTFLRREIASLTQQGLHIEIYSMLATSDAAKVPPLGDVPVKYFRWWEAAKLVVALPREIFRDPSLLGDGWRMFRKHLPPSSENFWATLWAVFFAVCRAESIRQNPPDMFHGVRATGPATAAAILSRLCHVPFSFGGHAYDIYRHGGDAFLEPKLHAAKFIHTTTAAAVAYLRQRWDGAPVKIVLARRGLDKLPPDPTHEVVRRPIHLLSVGRLVAKKGHTHQIAACAFLKSWGIPFQARIIGDGPLHQYLQQQINRAGLQESVKLCGAQPPQEVQEEYRWADIFWHTGIVDPQGDRDGLPNVIPEALSHCLPVITNDLPGTTEAVTHNQNGLIVNVANELELAEAIKSLEQNPNLRRRLGENGRHWVEENFLASRNTEMLAEAFKAACRK